MKPKVLTPLFFLTGLLIVGTMVYNKVSADRQLVSALVELKITVSEIIQEDNRYLVASGKEAYLKAATHKHTPALAVELENILLDRLNKVPSKHMSIIISAVANNFAYSIMDVEATDYVDAVKKASREIVSASVLLVNENSELENITFKGDVDNEMNTLINIAINVN